MVSIRYMEYNSCQEGWVILGKLLDGKRNEDFLADEEHRNERLDELKETAYRSLLPGLVFALKCILGELNSLRAKLGYGEVRVEGLEEGWVKPKKGGITEAGKKRLSEMMKQRWQQAYAEGKHVTELKPEKKNHPGAKKRHKSENPYPEG